MTVVVEISDDFDGGNIQYIDQRVDEQDPTVLNVIVHIKPDVRTELEKIAHMQYFSFCATITGLENPSQKIKYMIANAHTVSYPEAWSGSTVFYTDSEVTNVDSWKRHQDTFYTKGELSWEHVHVNNGKVYFSYFPPFCHERHLDLIAKCSAVTTVETLGHSLQGRAIECVMVGTGPQKCWIIHRQHPGETMAEHYAEGLLHRLLGLDSAGEDDPVVQRLLKMYSFHIVPCMCPDGAVMGHLRTNAAGANLNREWATVKSDYEAPTLKRSPEVYCVLNKMQETGVDCFLDIHGDEELPFNFMVGANHIPNWSPRLESLLGAFIAAYTRNNSDMQQPIGYPPPDGPEDVVKYMNVAVNQVAQRFECLAVTLEMPFKDCRSNPDPSFGWSPARSRTLGASVLEALEYVHPHLRGDSWTQFPPEDKYIPTTDDYDTTVERTEDDEPQFQMLKKRFYSDVHEIHKTPAAVSK